MFRAAYRIGKFIPPLPRFNHNRLRMLGDKHAVFDVRRDLHVLHNRAHPIKVREIISIKVPGKILHIFFYPRAIA